MAEVCCSGSRHQETWDQLRQQMSLPRIAGLACELLGQDRAPGWQRQDVARREAVHAGMEGPCLDMGSSPPAAERLSSRTSPGAAISAGHGLIVTIHFKILPNCLGTFFLW